MATIPGSHFVATTPAQPVNDRRDKDGHGFCHHPSRALSTLRSSSAESRNAPRAGRYQGLAVLSPSGLELNLISRLRSRCPRCQKR